MARILPMAEALEIAGVETSAEDLGAEFTFPVYRLRLAAPCAGLPLLPITQELHLLVEAGVFDEGVNLGAGEAFAERLRAICPAPGGEGGDYRVQLQFPLFHFVVGVLR